MPKNRKKPAGRPRKEGARFPGGKLKPESVGPNETVLAQRRAALGKPDASVSECKAAGDVLNLLRARDWLDDELQRAGQWYRDLYPRAGVPLPTVGVMDPERSAKGFDHGDGDAEASAALRRVWSRFTAQHGTAAAVRDAVLLDELPHWAVWWVLNAPEPGNLDRHPHGFGPKVLYHPDALMPEPLRLERATFLKGLRAIAEERKAGRAESRRDHPFNPTWMREDGDGAVVQGRGERTPVEPFTGPARETVLDYRDEETGEPDPVLNRAGLPVEVVRRRRA